MNIPSHYQSTLFDALAAKEDIDLVVCYFEGASASRAAEGWKGEHVLQPYEASCAGETTPEGMLAHVAEWPERIHLISSHFSRPLVEHFCKSGTPWCHWSEMPGIRLADLLGYRMELFRLLNPVMLLLKRNEGKVIKRHALGAFGQGTMARRAFGWMGVPDSMTANLFYAPSALKEAEADAGILEFAGGRKVFLSVNALSPRKGIDVLLKAFAQLHTQDWCVVFCGLDRENGKYQQLAEKLGITDKVLFLGAWPSDRIAEVYAAADVFVLSSRFDGWGAVLNEAASLKLPLIGTDLCGASYHAIEVNRNGYVARAGSVGSLKHAMNQYVSHPEKIGAHGAQSKQIFEEQLTPAVNAERLVMALKNWSSRAG